MPQNPAITAAFKKPFNEQVAFFRQKLGRLLPTERWTDVFESQHDKAFMVAGAAQADLLSDLAAAVDAFTTQGLGIEDFRKDFDKIVADHGWDYRGPKNWRTRVIYTTNLATSYSAGRLAQLKDAGFEYWMYQHSGLSKDPRPEHLAWSGTVLRADDPWWETHYPPNDWGCQCRVVGVASPEDAQALGGKLADAAPTEEGGVGRGWGYQPGAGVVDTVSHMATKIQNWDYSLAKAYMQGVPDAVKDSLAVSYRKLPSTGNRLKRYAAQVMEARVGVDVVQAQTIGLLATKDAAQISKLTGIDVAGFDFSATATNLAAMQPGAISPDAFASIPKSLNFPDSISSAASNTGLPKVAVEKTLNKAKYSTVWEVQADQKTLTLVSAEVK